MPRKSRFPGPDSAFARFEVHGDGGRHGGIAWRARTHSLILSRDRACPPTPLPTLAGGRQVSPKPVNEVPGFRRVPLQGLKAARGTWLLVCLALDTLGACWAGRRPDGAPRESRKCHRDILRMTSRVMAMKPTELCRPDKNLAGRQFRFDIALRRQNGPTGHGNPSPARASSSATFWSRDLVAGIQRRVRPIEEDQCRTRRHHQGRHISLRLASSGSDEIHDQSGPVHTRCCATERKNSRSP